MNQLLGNDWPQRPCVHQRSDGVEIATITRRSKQECDAEAKLHDRSRECASRSADALRV